jgi:hypothetical protein
MSCQHGGLCDGSCVRQTECHGAAVVKWPPRCRRCWHRVAIPGYIPRQTRKQPVWTWPAEILYRIRAMLRL